MKLGVWEKRLLKYFDGQRVTYKTKNCVVTFLFDRKSQSHINALVSLRNKNLITTETIGTGFNAYGRHTLTDAGIKMVKKLEEQ